MSFIWTETRVDALKKMWAAGKSGSEIAEAFGYKVSRSAICGKVHRLKLPSRGPSGAERSRKSMAQAGVSISVPKKRPATQPKSMKVAAPKPAAIAEAKSATPIVELTQAVGARLVPLLEIRDGECRFPVEDSPLIYCGADVEAPHLPYCGFHCRIAYTSFGASREGMRRLAGGSNFMSSGC